MAELAAEQLEQLAISDPEAEKAVLASVRTSEELELSSASSPLQERHACEGEGEEVSVACCVDSEAGAEQPEEVKPEKYKPTPRDHQAVDLALRQALAEPNQRQTVLNLEAQVLAFIANESQEVLEFPPYLSNYQRMLAHRVGQHFGLLTTSQDYTAHGAPGRVLAHKDPACPPKLFKFMFEDLDVSGLVGRSYGSRPGSAYGDAPKVLVKRPGIEGRNHYGRHMSPGGMPADAASQPPFKSAQDKETEYYQARERLLGKGPAFEGPHGQHPYGRGRGRFGGGRGGFVPYANGMGLLGGRGPGAFPGGMPPNNSAGPGVGGEEWDGRGRKALYKDRDKDQHDPDYRRGTSRYPGMAFDPAYVQPPPGGIYNAPTYGSEFPTLKRVGSNANSASGRSFKPEQQGSRWPAGSPSFRPSSTPQPPPPPGGPQVMPGTPPGKNGSYQATSPAAAAPPGMHMAGVRPMAGYAMSPYSMQAMGMGMVPGLPPQAMYSAPGALPMQMGAAGYGYMAHVGGDMGMAHPAAAYGMYGYAGYPAMAPGYAMPYPGPAMSYPGPAAAAAGYDASGAYLVGPAQQAHAHGEKSGFSSSNGHGSSNSSSRQGGPSQQRGAGASGKGAPARAAAAAAAAAES